MNTEELLTVIETDISFVNQQIPELKKVSIGVSINANVMLHDMYEKSLSLGLGLGLRFLFLVRTTRLRLTDKVKKL